MKTLLKTPELNNYDLTVNDMYEDELNNFFCFTDEDDKDISLEDFIEKYEDSSEYYNWLESVQRMYEEGDWLDFTWELDSILKKTRIKEGFLEILNGGWRSEHGLTENFEITSQNLLDKCFLNGDFSLEIKKDGHQLYIIRYSHDEPTGATIMLKSSKHRNSVYDEVFAP